MTKDPLSKKLKRTLIKMAVLKNWHKVVLPETQFSYAQEMYAKLRNGLVFHMKSSSFDLPILYQIFWNNVYDLSIIKNIQKPKILDIGGHIGMFAGFAASRVKDATIYSYEPDPANTPLFKENIKVNGLNERVKLKEVAVCAERGERKLYINPTNTSMNNMFQPKASRGMTESITVPCITLQDILKEYNVNIFDYAKIDCEGSEYELLLNASQDVLNALPRMIIEWHGNTEHTPEELVSFLKKSGYATTFSRKPRMISAIRRTES